MSNPLQHYKILMVDADMELGQVLRNMLSEMGFTNVRATRSGREALSLLNQERYDFLLTEWHTQQVGGLDLIKTIRTDPKSPNPMLPIIMMSGRAEKTDVIKARDFGINEYLIKPLSAQSIYNRLERIIEQPRQFVVSEKFIGPDRRNKGKPPPGVADRRSAKITPELAGGKIKPGKAPKLFLPDFSLKLKLGNTLNLKTLITPAVLSQAQKAVEIIADDSLSWIRDNLRELKLLFQMMRMGNAGSELAQQMAEIALTLNSRASTFGYTRAGEIAYMLYIFSSGILQVNNTAHHTVVGKHVDVLHVILGNNMRGDAGAMGAQIVTELKNLIQKCHV